MAISGRMCGRGRGAAARERGSVYVLAAGAATLVAIAGLSVIAIARASGREEDSRRAAAACEIHAASGIEIALSVLNADASWRTRGDPGVVIGPFDIDGASVRVVVDDPADGNLADDPREGVRIVSVARMGGASRALSVLAATAEPVAHPALMSSVYAGGWVRVDTNHSLATGALMSRTGVDTRARLSADVTGPQVRSSGFISGRVSEQTPGPLPGVPAGVLSAATTIPYSALPSGKIDKAVLTPSRNPWGASNPRGIYRIAVPGDKTLEITRSRLRATLIVQLSGSAELKLVDEVHWEPGRDDQPALIVTGSSSRGVVLEASEKSLSEADAGVNFNPAGAGFAGPTDTDRTDTYANVIRGVIHVEHAGVDVTVRKHTRLEGPVIASGEVRIAETPSMSPLAATAPLAGAGYGEASGTVLRVVPGSARWVVDGTMP